MLMEYVLLSKSFRRLLVTIINEKGIVKGKLLIFGQLETKILALSHV